MLLHFRTLVTCLIFEAFGTPYLVRTHEFGLGRRHNSRSVATFGIIKPVTTTKPAVTTIPAKQGRDIASKLFIFDTGNDNFTLDSSEELDSTKNKPNLPEPRESLNERQERIRLEKLELQNHGVVDFDGSGVRARGGIWEESKK